MLFLTFVGWVLSLTDQNEPPHSAKYMSSLLHIAREARHRAASDGNAIAQLRSMSVSYDLYFFLFNLSYVGSVAAEWQGSHWRERSDPGRISRTYRSGFIDKLPRYPRPVASSTGFLAKTVSFWMHTSEINLLLRKLLSCTCLMM